MTNDRRTFLKGSVAGCAASMAAPPNQLLANEKKAEPEMLEFREQLLACLGGDWPAPCPLDPRVIRSEAKDGYRLEWIDYQVETGDRVPAIMLVPDQATEASPAPGVAVWHQHNGEYHLGKSEPAGLAGNPMHHTGVALAKAGFVVLCPDALCFEERQDPTKTLSGGRFERFEFLRYVVDGRCMAWKNILDMRRAIDYLAERPEVASERLGCYGHSMGSTHTWMVGPWEPRLKVLVGNCCLPTYEAIHRTHILHCFPNFVPGVNRYGDTPDIVSLIAPRRLHLNFGEQDGGSPIQEVRNGIATIAAAYKQAGAEGQFTSFVQSDTGHVLSPEMWAHVKHAFTEL